MCRYVMIHSYGVSSRVGGVLEVVLGRVSDALATSTQGGAKWQVYRMEQLSCSMIITVVREVPFACR